MEESNYPGVSLRVKAVVSDSIVIISVDCSSHLPARKFRPYTRLCAGDRLCWAVSVRSYPNQCLRRNFGAHAFRDSCEAAKQSATKHTFPACTDPLRGKSSPGLDIITHGRK